MGRFLPQFSLKNYYNKATSQLYFSDEEKIYALGLRRDGGKYDWEFGLDKNKVGEMPLKKVYAVNETWVGTVPRTQTVSTGGGWSYSYTTGGTDAEGQASFLEDVSGADIATTYTSWGNIWGVTAKRCLRVLFDEKSLLVFGSEGIGMVDVSSGKARWVTEWDYDNEAVQYIPKAMSGKVVYCVDRKLTSIDLASGKQVWQVKEAKKPRFFTSPDRSYIFSIDEEVISGYQVRQ